MDPRYQAKKLMFWRVNVSTAGEVSVAVSIGPLAAMGSGHIAHCSWPYALS